MSQSNADELVNVPVPRRYLLDVYRLLGELEQKAASGAAQKASSDTARKENREHWWAVDGRMAHLKREINNPTVLALLNLTASQPTNWVGFDKVYQAARCSSDQARADLRGLTTRIKRVFPNNPEGLWPVDIKDGSPIQYRMPEEIARQWKRS